MIRVRLQRKSSSLDLNDPAVMEGVLQQVHQLFILFIINNTAECNLCVSNNVSQLKQKLKDQGLKDDVTLSWRKQADGKVFRKEKKKKKDEL